MAIRNKIADEQTSSLGGWLFADLFLLIMVIGLAGFNKTERVVAPTTSTSTTSTSTTVVCTSEPRFRSTPFTGSPSYTRSSARERLLKEVRDWTVNNGFKSPKIAVAIVRGGSRESNQKGQAMARTFWNSTVRSELSQYVDLNTADEPFGNTGLAEGSYQLQLFFVEVAKDC